MLERWMKTELDLREDEELAFAEIGDMRMLFRRLVLQCNARINFF